jgi:hypothetical protein
MPDSIEAKVRRSPALGAGGREFESRRPDQPKQLIYLQCRVSALLAHL